MTYNKPELAVVTSAIATIKGDKESSVILDTFDNNPVTASAYQADE
jgi:hypothetical protein